MVAPISLLPVPRKDAGELFQREFRALAWSLARRWDRVEGERRAELVLRPEDPIAHVGLSIALVQQGRLEEALKETEAARKLDPKRAGVVFQQGLILQRMDRLSDAEVAMRLALEMEPEEAERRLTLGALLAAQGKLAEASAMLRRAAEHSPNHPLVQWRLGLTLQAEGKTDEALLALRRGADLAEPLPPLHVIRVDLAEALQKAGKPEAAEHEWRSLAQSDDDPDLQYRLAACLAEQQKSPEALQVLQHCLSLLSQHDDPDLLKKANELKSRLETKAG
jgi:tetratricopeptide (TPR) repeat protein